jgi:TetR/AcrR family transcriptional repressor of nem operon
MSNKREQLEQAATDAIKKDGLRGISFRTLADEVGVKSASVHYHFPTKADLAQAVVVRYAEAFATELDAIERRETGLLAKLEALVGLFEATFAADDFCLCGMLAAEVSSLDEPTRAALNRFFGGTETWLKRQFEAHADELASDLPPATLAAVFVSGLEGALLLDRTQARDDRLGAYRAFSRTLVR